MRRLAAATALAALLLASLYVAPGRAQSTVDIDPILVTFDDPTVLARSIEARMSSTLASCMNSRGFEYFVAPDARFELTESEVVPGVIPIEPSILELAPLVLDPQVIESEFVDTGLFEQQAIDNEQFGLEDTLTILEVDPDFIINTSEIPPLEELPVFVDPRVTDEGIRLNPDLEGYGVSLDPLQALPTNPNLEFINSLNDFDRDEVAIGKSKCRSSAPHSQVRYQSCGVIQAFFLELVG